MAEIITETVTTQDTSPQAVHAVQAPAAASARQTTEYIMYFVLGLLEVLLAFRFVLKLMGANPVSSFVSAVYTLSQIFILPFEGIFRRAVTQGVETASVLEPATIVAMIVYLLLGWGLVKLLRILSGERQAN